MQNIQAKPQTEYIMPTQSSNNGENFDQYLSRAEKPAEKAPIKNDGYHQDRGNQFKKDKVDNTEPEQKTDTAKNDKPEKIETPKKPEAAKETDDTVKTEEFSEEDYDEASREIIEKLAGALGLPVEQIQQMLIMLNIKPLEISDDAVLNDFVQTLVGATSAEEMLTLPNVKETFAAVESVMADYEEIAQDFIQKLENEQIGKPKFIDAGRENMPQFASADDSATVAETMNGTTKPLSDAADVSTEMVKDVEVKTATAPKTEQQSETAGQSFGQNQSETADDTLLAETDETMTVMNTAMAADPDAPLSFEKINLKAEAMKNINTEDVINQIAEKIKVDVKGEATEIKVSLRPEHLGDVTLKITTQNGIVTAQFVAESQRIKEIIEAGFNNLKDVLQQKGINISQLSVSVGQENAEKQMGYFNQQQEKSSRRIHQMINNIVMDTSPADLAGNYLNDADIYDIQVDYKA
jgi:flagellar hook-length control protein FliK